MDDPATYGKAVLLARVLSGLQREEMTLVDMEQWFRACNDAMRRPERILPSSSLVPSYLVDCRGENGLALIFPVEVYRLVLAPLAADASGSYAAWLAGLALEYQRSLLVFQLALDPSVFEFSAKMLARAGKSRELYQMVEQYSVFADSSALAFSLYSEFGKGDAGVRQIALDMLKRLGDLDAMLGILVENMLFRPACELVMANPTLLNKDEGAFLVKMGCASGVQDLWMIYSCLSIVRPSSLEGRPSRLALVLNQQLPRITNAQPVDEVELRTMLGFVD